MSQGLFSIGGLASGLDTQGIIAQLMQLERVPVVRMQQRQDALRKIDEAWGTITTKLSGVRGALDALVKPSQWAAFAKATSSSTTAVDVSVTGTPEPGSIAIEVEKLAVARRRASGDTFSGLDADMGARTLTIQQGAETWDFDAVDFPTLGEFVDAVNDSDAPVRAQALRVSETEYRLVLTAEQTGVANDFTITDGGWSLAWTSPEAAQDAELRIGDTETGLTVTRSSNTITDLVDGVTINLKATTVGSLVTINTTRDTDKAVAAVKKLVDTANALFDSAASLSKYDADKKLASPLTGNSTLRRLTGDLLTTLSSFITGADAGYDTPSELGISLTSEGKLSFDETVLRDALAADWENVTTAFTRGATTDALDARASYVLHGDRTVVGTYRITATQAATQAVATGEVYVAPGAAESSVFTIAQGGKSANITIDETHTDVSLAIAEINERLEAAGITSLIAEESAGAIRLSESRYGSAGTFNVTFADPADEDWGLTGSHAGVDAIATVERMVDGAPVSTETVTANGRSFAVTEGDADGLGFTVTATSAEVSGAGGSLALGTLDIRQGLAGAVSGVVAAREGSTGEIQMARDELDSQIELFQERIEAFEIRLVQREALLRKQFTTLETAMQRLVSQGNWLSSQLGSLSASRGGDR